VILYQSPNKIPFLRAFLIICFAFECLIEKRINEYLLLSIKYSVYFLNTTTGFLSSSRPIIPPGPYGGEIIKTTNGGNNWYRVLFDTTFRVKGIRFINNNTGFAVGGVLCR